VSLPSSSWTLIPDPEPAGETLDRLVSHIATGVDWAIDLDTGDLEFPLRYTTGLEAVAQAIRIRLLNFKGEWFLNLDDGIPYLARKDGSVTRAEALLGQRWDEQKFTAEIRTAIMAAPHVDDLPELSVVFDGPTRTASVTFKARTSFGVVEADELEL
jgi:hypothetical protein